MIRDTRESGSGNRSDLRDRMMILKNLSMKLRLTLGVGLLLVTLCFGQAAALLYEADQAL